MKFRRTNKVGKCEVKKVKNKGAVSKNVVRVAFLHAPLNLFSIFLTSLAKFPTLSFWITSFDFGCFFEKPYRKMKQPESPSGT